MKERTIAAGAFKQGCLALLDEVATSHEPLLITKRGRPVARLVPVEDPTAVRARILSKLRGSIEVLVTDEELMAPLDEQWDATSPSGPRSARSPKARAR